VEKKDLTRAAVARRLAVSITQVIRYERAGRLSPVRDRDGVHRFRGEDVEQLVLERATRRGQTSPMLAQRQTTEREPVAEAGVPPLAVSGFVLSHAEIGELRRLLGSKIPTGAALVARVRAAVEDYAALEAELRTVEDELAERTVALVNSAASH
jgi:DNA-binding transcriptional MerR regulator